MFVSPYQSNELGPLKTQRTICFPFGKSVGVKISALKNDKIKLYFASILDMYESNKDHYQIWNFQRAPPSNDASSNERSQPRPDFKMSTRGPLLKAYHISL